MSFAASSVVLYIRITLSDRCTKRMHHTYDRFPVISIGETNANRLIHKKYARVGAPGIRVEYRFGVARVVNLTRPLEVTQASAKWKNEDIIIAGYLAP